MKKLLVALLIIIPVSVWAGWHDNDHHHNRSPQAFMPEPPPPVYFNPKIRRNTGSFWRLLDGLSEDKQEKERKDLEWELRELKRQLRELKRQHQ